MAISLTYCDYGSGNDYKGTTFIDGAFTVADMTLTKTGAFAASKANHWLYLADNGSGNVTAGYYRIASVTSANAVVLAASPKSGATDPTDVVCTQHDGTTSLPWRSVQGALDLITRDATNGDQININAGTAQVLAAALTYVTYGTPTAAAPLVLRGYTTAANDGGRGAITLADTLQLSSATWTYASLIDLDVAGVGAATQWMVQFGSYCYLQDCTFTPNGYVHAVSITTGVIARCYATGCTGYSFKLTNGLIYGCYAVQTSTSSDGCIGTAGVSSVVGNIVLVNHVDAYGINVGNQISQAVGNIVYNRAAGTKIGIRIGDSSGLQLGMAANNIVCGFSGAGGVGIGSGALNGQAAGYNAFYNNTANETYGHQLIGDLGGDVALAADPFTSAATGDFSLTTAGAAALRSLGWPASYLGAHANTDPHITIGAMQLGPTPTGGGGGWPKIASALGRSRM